MSFGTIYAANIEWYLISSIGSDTRTTRILAITSSPSREGVTIMLNAKRDPVTNQLNRLEAVIIRLAESNTKPIRRKQCVQDEEQVEDVEEMMEEEVEAHGFTNKSEDEEEDG